LKQIAPIDHSWVDGEVGPMDDAALLRPENGAPFVFTVDFITPIVDDPYAFGAIAAANALSDVYAMGGQPQVALAICGFPTEELGVDVLAQVLKGGRDKAAEAGCALVGGHTVLDPEPKYGLSVVGSLDAGRSFVQTAARPGDKLVLTKPIGSGIAAQAIKNDRLEPGQIDEVVANLSLLNRGARDAGLAAGANSATDITGFGLLGHLHNMASAAGLSARIGFGRVPFYDFVRALAEDDVVPGGSKKNLLFVAGATRFGKGVGEIEQLLLADAQTSGGLLLTVPADRESELIAELERQGTPTRAVIGELVEGEAGAIEVSAD
jgi:selenide,water dikinase